MRWQQVQASVPLELLQSNFQQDLVALDIYGSIPNETLANDNTNISGITVTLGEFCYSFFTPGDLSHTHLIFFEPSSSPPCATSERTRMQARQ